MFEIEQFICVNHMCFGLHSLLQETINVFVLIGV